MTCKSLLVIALVAGCTEEVPTLYATTTAKVGVELAPPDDNLPPAYGHYRWELLEAPYNAAVVGLHDAAETPAISITPPLRGFYAYDRWFVGPAAKQVSYHVLVTVDGAAPTAAIAGPTTIGVGVPATFDGSASSNPEHRTLTYQWRLASRPGSSAAGLGDAMTSTPTMLSTLSFVADVAGKYDLELRVFDGELWSASNVLAFTAQ